MIDLRNVDDDTWMNVARAERVKGSKLSQKELARVRSGERWNGASEPDDDVARPEDQD